MPKKIPSKSSVDTNTPPPQDPKPAPTGRWKHQNIRTTTPKESARVRSNTETSVDSGIDSPARERTVSPYSSTLSAGSAAPPEKSFDFSKPPSPSVLSTPPSLLGDNATVKAKPLGRGSHGTVHKVTVENQDKSKQYFALKTSGETDKLDNELRMLQKARPHPNLVKCHGYAEVAGEKGLLFECISGLDLGVLTNRLADTPMPVGEFINALKFLEHQKLLAVAQCEASGVVHSDLKPSNFLFDTAAGVVKLIDFGSAVMVGENYNAGHEDFAPPETLMTLGSRERGPSAETTMDSYPMGQMLHQTITGAADGRGSPFLYGVSTDGLQIGEKHAKIFQMVFAAQRYMKPDKDGIYQQPFPMDAESIKERALAIEQRRHSPADEKVIQTSARILEPELEQMLALVNGLMHPEPTLRLTPEDALEHKWFKLNEIDHDRAIKTLSRLIHQTKEP